MTIKWFVSWKKAPEFVKPVKQVIIIKTQTPFVSKMGLLKPIKD